LTNVSPCQKTHAACTTLRGVDCFFDQDFVDKHGSASDGKNAEALAWRKVHAALSLVAARVPVVLLDADTVFLRDPSPAGAYTRQLFSST
jgi:hypothetical protein